MFTYDKRESLGICHHDVFCSTQWLPYGAGLSGSQYTRTLWCISAAMLMWEARLKVSRTSPTVPVIPAIVPRRIDVECGERFLYLCSWRADLYQDTVWTNIDVMMRRPRVNSRGRKDNGVIVRLWHLHTMSGSQPLIQQGAERKRHVPRTL